MRKIRCVIVDDEPVAIRLLRMYCEQLSEYCEVTAVFSNGDDLIDAGSKIDFDLLLLDIDMEGMKGTDVARILSERPIIFVTGRNSYDSQVLDIHLKQENIITLIRKPVDKDALEKAFKKYLQTRKRKDSVVLHTAEGDRNFLYRELLMITSKMEGFKPGVLSRLGIAERFDPRNKILVTTEGVKLVLRTTFSDLTSSLPSEDFFQINKSTIIARKAVLSHRSDEIEFTKDILPFASPVYFGVSPECLRDFKSWYRQS